MLIAEARGSIAMSEIADGSRGGHARCGSVAARFLIGWSPVSLGITTSTKDREELGGPGAVCAGTACRRASSLMLGVI